MKFEGIDFNEGWMKSISEAEFVAHESHHGLSEKQLKEAYRWITGKKKSPSGHGSQPPSESVKEAQAP